MLENEIKLGNSRIFVYRRQIHMEGYLHEINMKSVKLMELLNRSTSNGYCSIRFYVC